MPIKHIYKSLVNINKKTFFFLINFSSIVKHQKKKKKKIFSILTLYVQFISILVNAGMHFNYCFDFTFVLAQDPIVN